MAPRLFAILTSGALLTFGSAGPAWAGPDPAAKAPALESASVKLGSGWNTRHPSAELSKAWGFHVARRELMRRVEKDFPDLAKAVQAKQTAYERVFAEGIAGLEAELVHRGTTAEELVKMKAEIHVKLAEKKLTEAEAKEVAQGKAMDPTLQPPELAALTLAYDPNVRRNPAAELDLGVKRSVACPVTNQPERELRFDLPRSWTGVKRKPNDEDQQPKTFVSGAGTGPGAVTMHAGWAAGLTGLKTPEMVRGTPDRYIPDKATFVSAEAVKLSGRDALAITWLQTKPFGKDGHTRQSLHTRFEMVIDDCLAEATTEVFEVRPKDSEAYTEEEMKKFWQSWKPVFERVIGSMKIVASKP